MGSIVSERWVLTLYDCVKADYNNIKKSKITMRFGTTAIDKKGGQTTRMLKIELHADPNIDHMYYWEVAMVKTMDPITLNACVRIANWKTARQPKEGDIFFTGSFGADGLRDFTPCMMMMRDLQEVPRETCRVNLNYPVWLDALFTICVVQDPSRVGWKFGCDGDYGAPVLLGPESILMGMLMVNNVSNCGAVGLADVVILTDPNLDFIHTTIESDENSIDWWFDDNFYY